MCAVTSASVGQGWKPSVTHDQPESVKVGKTLNITVDFDIENISSVYIIWWDVEENDHVNMMYRTNDDKTWMYEIPAQQKTGNIYYRFSIEVYPDVYSYPEDYYEKADLFEISVEEKGSRWTDWRYIVSVIAVLAVTLVFFEYVKRKVPLTRSKKIEEKHETEEDRWRKL
ncbi:MAG: hypothetical protein R6U61_06030 [Thermoplasmata archaeon]